VFSLAQAFFGLINAAAGCFADRDFAQPNRRYWTSRHHRWLACPEAVELQDTQPTD